MAVAVSLFNHVAVTGYSPMPYIAEHCDSGWFTDDAGERCWFCGGPAMVRTRSGARVKSDDGPDQDLR